MKRTVEYETYIKSDAWRVRRQPILDRAAGVCERCKQRPLWLEVHHRNYDRLGHERDSDLQALCHPCHEKADDERREEAEDEAEEALWEARLDGWATKRYGDRWEYYPGYDRAEDAFTTWLERRGEL